MDTSVLADPVRAELGRPWAASVVTIGELQVGALLAPDPATRAERIGRLTLTTSYVPVLPVDAAVAARYAELRATTGRRAANDLWIAATALAHGLELVTRDEAQARLPLVTTRLVA